MSRVVFKVLILYANSVAAVDGLAAAYNMAPDLSGVLAVLSIAICGDPIAGTWSIGGGYPGALGLLGQPTGILGTHNRYEGDASIVRVSIDHITLLRSLTDL